MSGHPSSSTSTLASVQGDACEDEDEKRFCSTAVLWTRLDLDRAPDEDLEKTASRQSFTPRTRPVWSWRMHPVAGPCPRRINELHPRLTRCRDHVAGGPRVPMPFLEADRPSIQLGLLKAIGEQHGFPVRTLHAEPRLRGPDRHRRSTGRWPSTAAGRSATGCSPSRPSATRHRTRTASCSTTSRPNCPTWTTAGTGASWLQRVRRRGRPGLPRRHRRASWLGGARVVGFSSTFQQNTASFALARRLKQRYPGIVTVFGGANFDGEMGLELVRCVGLHRLRRPR